MKMDYPKDEDVNSSIEWKEFIASKVLVFSSLMVSSITFILFIASMMSPLWQVFNSDTIDDRNYQLQMGLLWYQVVENNYNVTKPLKIIGPFSYDISANINDKLSKESYAMAGATTFGFMLMSTFGQFLSIISCIFSLIGFGPKALPTAFAYGNWGFSIFSSWLSLFFVSLYPLMRKVPSVLYVPITSSANQWLEVKVARLPVDASWIIAFITSIVSSVVQSSIMLIPVSVLAYKKFKQYD